jgi:hypothetical protein
LVPRAGLLKAEQATLLAVGLWLTALPYAVK